MKIQREQVGPKRAAEMLELNTRNRPLRKPLIADIAGAMARGEWIENGETIKFNAKGMVDGQHRLNGIIKSGVTLWLWVAYDVPDGSFDTVDRGAGRTVGDTLAHRGEINCNRLAAAASWAIRYEDGMPLRREKYTPAQVKSWIDDNPAIRDSVNDNATTKAPWRCGLICAVHFLCARRDPTLARLFFDAIYTGENITRRDPAYIVREAFFRNMASMRKLPPLTLMALVIKGWNAERSGVHLKNLRFASNESFPKVR